MLSNPANKIHTNTINKNTFIHKKIKLFAYTFTSRIYNKSKTKKKKHKEKQFHNKQFSGLYLHRKKKKENLKRSPSNQPTMKPKTNSQSIGFSTNKCPQP